MIPVSNPFPEPGPPVLDEVSLGKLLTLTVAEPALALRGSDHVDAVQVDLQPFLGLLGDLMFGTPGTPVTFRPHPENSHKKKYLKKMYTAFVNTDFHNGEISG
jgi:hypothetical protein